MYKLLIYILVGIYNINSYASSAVYQDETTGQHYGKINEANGEDARVKAQEHCESKAIGKCKLIYKTDYGGYGAIAIGNKSNGYAYGKGKQTKADRLALEACKEDSIPSTCRITSRWHDEGKTVIERENVQQSNDDVCGVNPATGYPILCSTGVDVQGNPSGYKNGMHINQITQPNRY
jgi:hypothetical protein